MIVSGLDSLTSRQFPKDSRPRQFAFEANIHGNRHLNRFLWRCRMILALTSDEWSLHHRRDITLIRDLMDASVGQKAGVVAAHVLFRPSSEITVDEFLDLFDV